jgi:hypothetical protein
MLEGERMSDSPQETAPLPAAEQGKKQSLVPAILTRTSVIFAALYVVSFIYIKTYLAHFGVQVDQVSLDVVNLLLAHRYFLTVHLFIGAGFLVSLLRTQLGTPRTFIEYVSLGLLLAGPVLVINIMDVMARWSESGTPIGFNISAKDLLPAYAVAWGSGAVLACLLSRLKKSQPQSYSLGAIYVLIIASVGVAALSYRLFANASATDRVAHRDFQVIRQLVLSSDADQTIPGPCLLVFSDAKTLVLKCIACESTSGIETATNHVIQRESVRSYQTTYGPADSKLTCPQARNAVGSVTKQ